MSFFEELEEEIAFWLSGWEKPYTPRQAPTVSQNPPDAPKPFVEQRPSIQRATTEPHRPRVHTPAPVSPKNNIPTRSARHPQSSHETGQRSPESSRDLNQRSARIHPKPTAVKSEGPTSFSPKTSASLPDGKSVFLPALRAETMRMIPISSCFNRDDALASYHFENEILLVNSGTFSLKDAAHGIKTMFGDIRFLVAAKQKIRGIVLLRTPISIEAFKQTLLHLGRPCVYAPRPVIVELQKYLRSNDGFIQSHFVEIDSTRPESVSIGSFGVRILTSSTNEAHAVMVETPVARIINECAPMTVSEIALFEGELTQGDLLVTNQEHSLAFAMVKHAVFIGSLDATKSVSLEHWETIRFAENGNLLDITNHNEVAIHDFKLHLDSLFFDGAGIGNESSHVLKARVQMGESGVISIVFIVDKDSKSILGPIKLETRWLAYLHEAREIHRFIIKIGKASYEQTVMDVPDIEEKDLLKIIKKDLEKALAHKIERNPMIIPVIVEL